MGLELARLQCRGGQAAVAGHLVLQPVAGGGEQRLDLGEGGGGQGWKIGQDRGVGHGLSVMRHRGFPARFCTCEDVAPSQVQSNKISPEAILAT